MEIIANRAGQDVLTRLNDVPSDSASFNEGVGEDAGNFDSDASKGSYISTKIEPAWEDSLLGRSPSILMGLGIGCGILFALFIVLLVFCCRYRIQPEEETQSGKEKDTPLKKLIKQGRKLRSRLFKGSKKDPERSDNTSESAATSTTTSDDETQTNQHPTTTRTSKSVKFWCKEKQPTSIPEPQPKTDSLIFENYLVDERKPQDSCFVQFQSEKPSEVQAAQNPSTRSILPPTYEITLDGLTHHPRFYNDDVVHSVCPHDSEFISPSSSDSSEMRTQNNIHPLTSSDKQQNKIESSDVRTQNSVHHLPPSDRRQDKIESSENSVRQISGAGLGSGTIPIDNCKCQTVPHCSPRLLNDTPANKVNNTKNNLISVDISEPGAALDTELQSNSLIWQKSEENARLSYNTRPSIATERPVEHVDLHLKITSPNVMSSHEFVLPPPKGSALQKVSLHVDSDPALPIRVWTESVKNQADCVRTISDTKCHQHIEKETATVRSFSDAFISSSESVWRSDSEIRRSSIWKSIAHNKSHSDEAFQVILSLPGSGQKLVEKKKNVQTSLNTLQTESLTIHLGRRISATLQLKEKESSEGKFESFNNCDHEKSEDIQREANTSDHDTRASTFQLVIEKSDGKKYTEETKPLTVHIYSPGNSLNQKNDFVSNKNDLEILLEKPPRKINPSKIDIVQVSTGAKIDTRTSEKQSETSIKRYSGAFKPNLKTFKTPRISLDQLKQFNKPLVSPELSDTKKLPTTLITEKLLKSHIERKIRKPSEKIVSETQQIRQTNFEQMQQIPRNMTVKLVSENLSSDTEHTGQTDFEQIKESPRKMSVIFTTDTDQNRRTTPEQIKQSPRKMSVSHPLGDYSSIRKQIRKTELKQIPRKMSADQSTRTTFEQIKQSPIKMSVNMAPETLLSDTGQTRPSSSEQIQQSPIKMSSYERAVSRTSVGSIIEDTKTVLRGDHIIHSTNSVSLPGDKRESENAIALTFSTHRADVKHNGHETNMEMKITSRNSELEKESKQSLEQKNALIITDSKLWEESKLNLEEKQFKDGKTSTYKEEKLEKKQNTESRKGVHMKENVPQSPGGYDMETLTRQSKTDTLYKSRQGTGHRSLPKNFVFELKNAVAQFSARRLEEPLNVLGKHFAQKTSSGRLFLTPEESLSGINTISIESDNTYRKSAPEYKNQHLDENVKISSGAHWVTSNTFGGLQRDVSLGRFKIPQSRHVEKPLSFAEQKKDLVDKTIDISLESPRRLSSDYLTPTEDTGSAEIVRYDVKRFESEDGMINISPSLPLPYARYSKDNTAESDSILNTEIYTLKQSKYKGKPSYLARPPIKHFGPNSLRLPSNKRTGLNVLKKSHSECSSTILSKSDFTSVGDDETKGTVARGIDMFEKRILKHRPKYLRKPYLQDHVKASFSTEWKSNTDDNGIDSMEKNKLEHRWSSTLCVNLPEPYFHCLEDQVQASSDTERFNETVHSRVNTFETSKIERTQRNLPTYELKYLGDKVQTSSGTELNVNTVNFGIDKFEKMRIKNSPKHSITTHVQHLNDHVQAASGTENKISNVRNIAERFENMKKSSPHHLSTYQFKRLGDRVIKTPGTQWHVNKEVTEINALETAPLKFSSKYVSKPYFRIIGDQVVTASDTAWNINTVNSMVDTLDKTELMHSSHDLKPKRKKLQEQVKTTSRTEWSKKPVESGSLKSKPFFKAGAGAVKAKASLEENADRKPIKTEIQTFEKINITGSPKHSSKPYFTQSGDRIRTASGTEWNVNKEDIATGTSENLRPKTSARRWKTSCFKRLADHAQPKSVPTYMSKPYFAHLGDQSRYTPGTEIIGSSVPIPIDKYEKVMVRGSQRPVSAPYVEATDQPPCLSRSHFKHLTRPYFTQEGDHIRTISGTEWNVNREDIASAISESIKPKTSVRTWKRPRLKYVADHTQPKSVSTFLSKPYFAHSVDQSAPGIEYEGTAVPTVTDKYKNVKVRESQTPMSASYVKVNDRSPSLSRSHFKHFSRPYFTKSGDHIRTISGTEWNVNKKDIIESLKPKTITRTWKTPRKKYVAGRTQSKSAPSFLSKPYFAHLGDQSRYTPGTEIIGSSVPIPKDKYEKVKVRGSQRPVSAPYVEATDQPPCLSRSHFKHLTRPYFTQEGDHIRTISGTEWNVNREDIAFAISESIKPKTSARIWKRPHLKYVADHTQPKSVPTFLSKPYFAYMGDHSYTPGIEFIGTSVPNKYKKAKVRDSQRPVSAPYVKAPEVLPCLSRPHFKHLRDYFQTPSGTEYNVNIVDAGIDIFERAKSVGKSKYLTKPHVDTFSKINSKHSPPKLRQYSKPLKDLTRTDTDVKTSPIKHVIKSFEQGMINTPLKKKVSEEKITSAKTDWKEKRIKRIGKFEPEAFSGYARTFSGTQIAPDTVRRGIDIFQQNELKGRQRHLSRHFIRLLGNNGRPTTKPKCIQKTVQSEAKVGQLDDYEPRIKIKPWGVVRDASHGDVMRTTSNTSWTANTVNRGIEKFEAPFSSVHIRTRSEPWDATKLVKRGVADSERLKMANGKQTEPTVSPSQYSQLHTENVSSEFKTQMEPDWKVNSEKKIINFRDQDPPKIIKRWAVFRDTPNEGFLRTTSDTVWNANVVKRGINTFNAPFPSSYHRLEHSGANIPLNTVEKGVNNFELPKNARANVRGSLKYKYNYQSDLKVPPSQYKPRLFPQRHGYGEHYFKGKKPGVGEMPVYRSQGLQRVKPFFTIYPHFFGLSQNSTDKLKMMQKIRDFRNTLSADNPGKVLPRQRSSIVGNHSNSCQEGSPRHRISSLTTLFDAKSRRPICRLRQKSLASDFRTRQLKHVPFPKPQPLNAKDEEEVSRQLSFPDQNFSASGAWKVKRGPRSFQIPLDKHMQSRPPGCPNKGDMHRKICSSVPQQHRSSTTQLCSEVSHCSLERGRVANSTLIFDAKSGLFCHRSQTPGIRICQHKPTISLESLPYKIAIRGGIRRETLQQQRSDASQFQSESSHSWLDRSPFRQVSSLRTTFEAKCSRFIHDLKSKPYSPQTPLTYQPVSTSPKSFFLNQAFNQHLSPRDNILTASKTPILKNQQYSNNSQSSSSEENAPNHFKNVLHRNTYLSSTLPNQESDRSHSHLKSSHSLLDNSQIHLVFSLKGTSAGKGTNILKHSPQRSRTPDPSTRQPVTTPSPKLLTFKQTYKHIVAQNYSCSGEPDAPYRRSFAVPAVQLEKTVHKEFSLSPVLQQQRPDVILQSKSSHSWLDTSPIRRVSSLTASLADKGTHCLRGSFLRPKSPDSCIHPSVTTLYPT